MPILTPPTGRFKKGWTAAVHGLSTGPRTEEGMRRLRAAVTKHGNRTAAAREFRALVRALRADARRVCEMV